MTYRSGIGYDIHRYVPGRPLMLGGVHIPHAFGLQGHSDADVLLHAVTDALLGAAGLGDIGEHFPDTDPAYKGMDSAVLASRAAALAKEKGFRIVNIDAVVVLQEPKLSPYKAQIASAVAKALGILPEQVSIKAKTNEGLDAVGAGQAVSSFAVALLAREGQE
jgi:2-C-methyl-D-erythritol 2,4-cyclodiphosphate synthase